MRKNTTYRVVIGSNVTRVRVPNDSENEFGVPVSSSEAEIIARNRAIHKLHGAAAYWWADSGLAGYGQVMRPSRQGSGSDAVTYRVRLSVDAETLFPVNTEARQAAADAWEESSRIDRESEASGFSDAYDGLPKNTSLSETTMGYDRGYTHGAECRRANEYPSND